MKHNVKIRAHLFFLFESERFPNRFVKHRIRANSIRVSRHRVALSRRLGSSIVSPRTGAVQTFPSRFYRATLERERCAPPIPRERGSITFGSRATISTFGREFEKKKERKKRKEKKEGGEKVTRQTRLLNTASYSLERRGEGVGMPEARWRHMRRELDGFVMRCYYEMVSTCSIMLFCRLSRYLALYSRLIDAEIGQNATRHLSVTPPRDIFFFAPGSIAAMTEAKEKTWKVRTVVSLSSSRARVRKREKERERRESRSRMGCQMSWT